MGRNLATTKKWIKWKNKKFKKKPYTLACKRFLVQGLVITIYPC